MRAGQDVSLGCELTPSCPPASSITWLRSDQDDLRASPRYPLVSNHPTMLTLKVCNHVWDPMRPMQCHVHRRRCQLTPGGIGVTRTPIRSWPMSVSRILCRWWTSWSLRWELSTQPSHQWIIVTIRVQWEMSRGAMLTNFGCMKLIRTSGKTNRYLDECKFTYMPIWHFPLSRNWNRRCWTTWSRSSPHIWDPSISSWKTSTRGCPPSRKESISEDWTESEVLSLLNCCMCSLLEIEIDNWKVVFIAEGCDLISKHG